MGKRQVDKKVKKEEKVGDWKPNKSSKKSWEQLCEMGRQARQLKEQSQWVLGDIAIEVEITYGAESLQKYAIDINVEYETIKRYRTVSKAWPKEICDKYKNADGDYWLSHRHFQLLAPREDREEWLVNAHDNGWSTKQLEVELKKKEGKFDEKLAIASVQLARGEFEEIIRWHKELSDKFPESVNEFSNEVVEKLKVGLNKAKNNS